MINLSILIPSWFAYVTACRKKSNCTSNTTAGHHWHFFSYKNPQNFYSHQLIYSDNILLPAILLWNEAWNLFWSSILTFMDLRFHKIQTCTRPCNIVFVILNCFCLIFSYYLSKFAFVYLWLHGNKTATSKSNSTHGIMIAASSQIPYFIWQDFRMQQKWISISVVDVEVTILHTFYFVNLQCLFNKLLWADTKRLQEIGWGVFC